jgi:hypothetical protein
MVFGIPSSLPGAGAGTGAGTSAIPGSIPSTNAATGGPGSTGNDVSDQGHKTPFLGEDYDYASYVFAPEAIGMSGEGTMDTLSNDIAGVISYMTLLVEGGGRASKIGGPLGNKYFIETSAKCQDIVSGEKVKRSIYINNIPDGTMPFISSGPNGVAFASFKGLIPGVLTKVGQMSPGNIMNSFTAGTSPKCQSVTMETRDKNNIPGTATGYITKTDLLSMPKSWFPNGTHPYPNGGDGFTTLHKDGKWSGGAIPNTTAVKTYLAALGLLGLFIFLRMFQKKIL